MMCSWRTVLVLLGTICGCWCCGPETFPNNTANALNQYLCVSPEEGTPLVDFKLVNLKAEDDNVSYPINISHSWLLTLQITNHGNQVNNLLMDVNCYKWEMDENLGRCAWQPLLSYGLMDDLEVCEWISCPLAASATENAEVKLDAGEYKWLVEPGLYMCNANLKNGDKPKSTKLYDFVPPPLGCFGYQSVIEV